MFKKFSNGCVNLVQRFLPDPFIFCIILTAVVFIAAMPATGQGPLAIVQYWGDGVWSLLGFSMQMVLVLVLGTALANAPVVQKFLKKVASIPKKPSHAIVFVTVIATVACWLNWGFGLIVGAIFAKEVAKQVKGVDYRLLIASAYSGFVVWHAGISGSIPLQVGAWTETILEQTNGVVTEAIPITETVFAPFNIFACVLILITMPIVNMLMHPNAKDVVVISPELLVEEEQKVYNPKTPAEKLECSRIMSLLIAVLTLAYIVYYFATKGFNLDLNIVNLIFLFLGIVAHGTPIRYVEAIGEAVKGAGGIVLQFPFYAGIMGIMTGTTPDGASLAGVISNFFVSISTKVTFPLWTFLSAGIVNFFVPSGGGQWAVQAPIMLPAGQALGVNNAITCMGIAWGDAWTNLLQPFWALPALGLAGLGARDIMGFCIIDLLLSGVIVCIAFILAGYGIL